MLQEAKRHMYFGTPDRLPMFYSQFLLSKKAPLGVVWMAGHCLRRLRKDQVQDTDIAISVDKILADEVREMTHRILGFLLLGVVRIYSRKVEYLFQASQELLNNLFSFAHGKDKHACTGVLKSRRPPICLPNRFKPNPFISLPKRFALDAAEVEDSEDGDLERGNKRPRLADGVQRDSSTTNLLINEKRPISEPELTACTPHKDVWSTPGNDNISLVGLEKLRGASFSMENHLDPTIVSSEDGQGLIDELTKKRPETSSTRLNNTTKFDPHPNMLDSISSTAPDMQMLFGDNFSLDDRLEPMILNETENAQLGFQSSSELLGPIREVEIDYVGCISEGGGDSGAGSATPKENICSLGNPPSFHVLSESETVKRRVCAMEDLRDSSDFVDQAEPGRAEKVNLVDSGCNKCSRHEFQFSDKTPNSNHPGTNPEGTSTLVTPSSKEHVTVRRKQKIVWDSNLVLSNSTIKSWLDDVSTIKRQRKQLGRTVLAEWKYLKLDQGPDNIFQHFITGFVKDHDSLEVKKSVFLKESSDGGDVVGPLVYFVVDGPISNISSPEQCPIVGGTHVSQEEETSPRGVNNAENVSDAFPSRKRITESFLSRKFMEKKKEKGEEVLNFTELVAGKTKGDSARIFYDILALISRDLIDVHQEEAYGDILLQKASKSKNAV